MSKTLNIALNKPARAAFHWDKDWNGNADTIDTYIGGLNNTIDDLPDLERHAGTFNGPTGVSISLNKTVDAVNEYGVDIIPTSRAAAIGDLWVTKETDSFTVHCAEANASDAFEALVYFKGDVSSYGGSIYRRYYVSPSTAIADHTIAATAGSLAYIINSMSGTSGVVELPGNRIYTLSDDFTLPSNIKIKPQPGAQLSIAAGKTLTINCRIDAGRWQIFRGDGDVTFGRGSIDYAFPEWFGAIADGAADCGAAVNKTADACRDSVIPILFGVANYKTTESFNFTGANYPGGYQNQGWTARGMGPGNTLITGALSAEYAIFDFSDCSFAIVEKMRIQGDPTGAQLCGVLHAMVGTNLALQCMIKECIIAGTFTESAYINHSSDLSKVTHSYFDGPCGAIITSDRDACGSGVIKSAYQTLTTTPNITLNSFEESQIGGRGGSNSGKFDSAVVCYEVMRVTFDTGTYIAQNVVAKAGIYVWGTTGGIQDTHEIAFFGRYENQTDAPLPGCFVWVAAEEGIRNCIFDCYVGPTSLISTDAGQWFYLEKGSIKNSLIRINPESAIAWSHVVTRAASTSHTIYDCDVFEQTDQGCLLNGIDAALFSGGCRFMARQYNDNWLNVGGSNSFFFSDLGRIDTSIYTGYNRIGKTTEKARKFVGNVFNYAISYINAGGVGEETAYTYTLPGAICGADQTVNNASLSFKVSGYFGSNSNTKTVKAKFGIAGSETMLVTNDITTAPNGTRLLFEVEITQRDNTGQWYYIAKLTIGNALQSIGSGFLSGLDVSTNTINFIITGDAPFQWGIVMDQAIVRIF